LRAKKGRIKRAMFQKLRTNRYIKASGRENVAVVEFTGKVQRIARIHQYGLKDRPNPHAKEVQYPERPLLGLDSEAIQLIEERLLIALKK
ncbi:phage virion morphogenesis protein, partial [Enterobacter hormaechei]